MCCLISNAHYYSTNICFYLGASVSLCRPVTQIIEDIHQGSWLQFGAGKLKELCKLLPEESEVRLAQFFSAFRFLYNIRLIIIFSCTGNKMTKPVMLKFHKNPIEFSARIWQSYTRFPLKEPNSQLNKTAKCFFRPVQLDLSDVQILTQSILWFIFICCKDVHFSWKE